MNYKYFAVGMDFASFVIEQCINAHKIDNIILFGSAARGDTTPKDIDIFIECPESLKKELQEVHSEYLKSVKARYWKLLGVTKDIHLIAGKIWPELQRSMTATGIILYGKYKGKTELNPWFLFSIKQGKKRSQNVALWRKLYGYKQKNNNKLYETKGLVIEYGGTKIARGVFAIPAINSNKITRYLIQQKTPYQIQQFWQEK